MPHNLFTPRFEDLPAEIPVFPLSGAFLMPETQLPLNIFEPRYLEMVNDVLSRHRLIGMIQPDSRTEGALCQTGCAGRIVSFNEADDGRFIILLSGLCRFDMVRETSTGTPYRTWLVDYSRFAADYELEQHLGGPSATRAELLDLVRNYGAVRKAEVDLETLARLKDVQIVNILVCGLGLEAASVQGLIESVNLDDRAELLAGLMRFEIRQPGSPGAVAH